MQLKICGDRQVSFELPLHQFAIFKSHDGLARLSCSDACTCDCSKRSLPTRRARNLPPSLICLQAKYVFTPSSASPFLQKSCYVLPYFVLAFSLQCSHSYSHSSLLAAHPFVKLVSSPLQIWHTGSLSSKTARCWRCSDSSPLARTLRTPSTSMHLCPSLSRSAQLQMWRTPNVHVLDGGKS